MFKDSVRPSIKPWHVVRHVAPFGIAVVCLWIVLDRMDSGVLGGIGPALSSLGAAQWLGAALATAVSFWALGRYDVILHRHFQTGITARAATISGAAAIALSQVLGLGVLTGALVRWRMLPSLSPTQAAKLTVGVAISFLVALSGILGVVLLVFPATPLPSYLGVFGVFVFIISAIYSILHVVSPPWMRRIRPPSLRALGQLSVLTFIDTAAAALALYLLLPEGIGIGFTALFPIYLAALFLAVITGTPGGLGPFELTILAFLPMAPQSELMASILAFRLVYYALPAVLAIVVLARPVRRDYHRSSLRSVTSDLLARASRAELGVCRQNGASVLEDGQTRIAVKATRQTLTALFAPVSGPFHAAFEALRHEATRQNRLPLVYKCTQDMAQAGRNAGWYALHIADEAVLNPQTFNTDGPAYRQLRRKLRQAQTAGVDVERGTPGDWPVLARIDAAWQARNGGARGLSMGRYCEAYLESHRIYIARQGADIIAFISLHENDREICLDLMRSVDDAANGTMHTLLLKAMHDAANEGRTRLSLAALPRQLGDDAHWLKRKILRLATPPGGAGLIRFKSCFRPDLEPLYAVAPTRASMTIALADLALAIRNPSSDPAHNDHEEKAFAARAQT